VLWKPAIRAIAAETKKGSQAYALIAGSVFRDTGFSLPGAEVEVTAAPEPGVKPKMKKTRAVSDARGEFAIRVPAAPMRYTVSVKAKGFRPQEKSAEINADERVDLFFRLEPEKP
jgi:hypothetical protein